MSTTYESLYGIDDLTDAQAVKEHGFKSEVRELRKALNALVQSVSLMMPGVLTSAPSIKSGTSDATTLRNEAFTAIVRGLRASVAAAETAFTATTHDVAATKEAWFALLLAADGSTLTIAKGADQTIGTRVLPQASDNTMVVGYVQVVTGSGGFDATTDDFAADGTKIASLAFYDGPVVSTVNSASLV